jgi:DNA-binding NarL/FixJ family response regulator
MRIAGAEGKLTLPAIRILLVDDSAAIRQILTSLLSSYTEFAIVHQSVNGVGAISKVGELQRDVILLDINLPDMNGLEVTRQIKSVAPSAEILLLSEHDLLPMVREGLRAGARGYLLKSDAPQELAIALRANISETLPVVVINEQGEEKKNKDEQEFSWCCLRGRGRGWRGTKRRRA